MREDTEGELGEEGRLYRGEGGVPAEGGMDSGLALESGGGRDLEEFREKSLPFGFKFGNSFS